MKGMTREWALTFAFCGLILLALAFGLTWVNIERTDMAYELRRLQTDIEAQAALISKLEVERNTLTTPDRLRSLASQYGLVQARPGQIRRLAATGEELPSPVLTSMPVPEKFQKKAPAPFADTRKAGAKGKLAAKSPVQVKVLRASVSGDGPEAEGNGISMGAVRP